MLCPFDLQTGRTIWTNGKHCIMPMRLEVSSIYANTIHIHAARERERERERVDEELFMFTLKCQH